jgi:hypothetical protein
MELSTGDIIVAERVADLMANYEYACIDGKTVIDLANLLCAFLCGEGVQTRPEAAEKYAREAGIAVVNS